MLSIAESERPVSLDCNRSHFSNFHNLQIFPLLVFQQQNGFTEPDITIPPYHLSYGHIHNVNCELIHYIRYSISRNIGMFAENLAMKSRVLQEKCNRLASKPFSVV